MLESLLGPDLYNHCNVEGIRKADNQVEQVFDASHNCHRLFKCVVVVRRTVLLTPCGQWKEIPGNRVDEAKEAARRR